MHCSTCGERLAPTDERCSACGSAIAGTAPDPVAAAIRRCPRCGYLGEGIGYFRRPGHLVILAALSLFTWGVGGVIYWLFRRRHAVCPNCGLSWFGARPVLVPDRASDPARFDPALPPAGTNRRVLGVLLALVAVLLVSIGLIQVEASMVATGGALGLAGIASFTWGWHALQERRRTLRHALERRVLHLATRRGGALTATEVASDLDLSLTAAEAVLLGMDDGFRVRCEITEDGVLVFEFPEVQRRGLPG